MKKKAGQAPNIDRSSMVRDTSKLPSTGMYYGAKEEDEVQNYGLESYANSRAKKRPGAVKAPARSTKSAPKMTETRKEAPKKAKPAASKPAKSAPKKANKKAKAEKKKRVAHPALVVVFVIVCLIGAVTAALYFMGFFKLKVEVTLADGTVQEMNAEDAYAELKTDTFFQGTVIDGIEVGGMTVEQAVAAVSAVQPEKPMEVHVSLDLEGMFIPIDFSDTGFDYNTREVCEKAFNQFRPSAENNLYEITECYNGMQALKNTPQTYETAYTVKIENVSQKIHAALDPLYDEYARVEEASIVGFDTENKQFDITPDKTGYVMDIDATADAVKEMFDSKDYTGTVKVITTVIEPSVTVEMINEEFGLIGEYSTKTSNNYNRNNNIAKACEYMNGTILDPGAEFSFNGVVGQRTSDRGFKEATVIQGGQYEQGLGGGICQVSSTLYNAVLKSNLKVTSRSGHAWPSDYVSLGLDATVDWPSLDFKFENSTDYQIVVVAWWDSSDSYVHCQIYGHKLPDGQYIMLESETLSTVAAGAPEYVEDRELPAGQRKSIRAAHNGYTVRIYQVWYDKDGNEIDRVEYGTTSYRSYGERIAVGTLLPDGTYAQFDASTGEVITPTPTPDPSETMPSDLPPDGGGGGEGGEGGGGGEVQPTDPQPTDPQPTDPQPTDPPPENTDTPQT